MKNPKQCHRDGCDSGAEFFVRTHIPCPEPGGRTRVVSADSTIRVCEKHADQALVRGYLFAQQNKEKITAGLMDGGYHEPDFMNARIEFVPIPADPVVVREKGPPAMCDRGGCTKDATHQVVQAFRLMQQRGKGPHVARLLTNLCVCEQHRRHTYPTMFQDKESRAAISDQLRKGGVVLPDLDSMALQFIPLVDGQRVNPDDFKK